MAFFFHISLYLSDDSTLIMGKGPPHIPGRVLVHLACVMHTYEPRGKGGTGSHTHAPSPNQPTVARRMEAQAEYAHVARTFLHIPRRLGMLRRCLLTRFLQSELSRKFVKSALLVGQALLLLLLLFFFLLFQKQMDRPLSSSSSFLLPPPPPLCLLLHTPMEPDS